MTLLRFIAALVVAAVARSWYGARGIWTALFNRSRHVAPELKRQRLGICRNCHVYYAPLQTCGSPLARDSSSGCHCFMPLKSGTWSNCWLSERGVENSGWLRSMNSFPDDLPPSRLP